MATASDRRTVEEYQADLEALSLNFPGIAREHLVKPKEKNVLAHQWRWADIERMLTESAEFQDALPSGRDGAERRIIRLQNPGLDSETASYTMNVAIQLLLPGEVARTHRHTASAFRFFLRGGAYTNVGGEKHEMAPGDLVLTPWMEWHDHGNEGDEAAMWMDGLDYPLVRLLDAMIYEYADEVQQPTDRTGTSDRRFGSPGVRPSWDAQSTERHSLIHYRYEDTYAALTALAEAGDVSEFDDAIVDYVNPANGKSVFPTIGCSMQMIRPGVRTRNHRHTGSIVYHAFEGEGSIVINGETYEYATGDFVIVPPWAWHEHVNEGSSPAILFSVHDLPALRALGLYWEDEA
jgi:gentisate 1,2-dioxygenase